MSKNLDSLKKRENWQAIIYFAVLTLLFVWITIDTRMKVLSFNWQALLIMAMLLASFVVLIHPLLRKSRTPWWVWLIMAIGFSK